MALTNILETGVTLTSLVWTRQHAGDILETSTQLAASHVLQHTTIVLCTPAYRFAAFCRPLLCLGEQDRTEVKESVKKPMRGRPVNNTEWVINASSTIEALALHLGVQTQNSSLGLSVRAGKPYKGWEFEYV